MARSCVTTDNASVKAAGVMQDMTAETEAMSLLVQVCDNQLTSCVIKGKLS